MRIGPIRLVVIVDTSKRVVDRRPAPSSSSMMPALLISTFSAG